MKVLEAKSLTVEHGGRAILDGVSILFHPGELVGLVGPNGAGKTTLLRHLAGLHRSKTGSVTLDGRNMESLTAAERGRIIGYMPQYFEPAWDFNVREIVELGASRASGTNSRFSTVIEENELTALLDRRWSRLSGGERARTLLAAVLIADPAVLLADEPGAGLDVRHRLDLLTRLRSLASGRIMVVVMHDLESAVRQCDRLVVLNHGRVALDGPSHVVAADRTLDAAFGVNFQRAPFNPELGPLLPNCNPPSR